jgi:hypothetical protein
MKINVSNKAEWGELHLALGDRRRIVEDRLERATTLGYCPLVVEASIKRLAAIEALEGQIGDEQSFWLPGEPI